ncbi:EthD domain-containing protein [Novosphingobium sp.]|jgi:hypothetical protein|uniref:EthD domain-containing protein n=1 Tax=Novosphingobium sp. TaxID=1874826 RepID=UPI001EC1E6E3|nr:EthD domain-containing protein [Novosphingobium sp.]MBK6802345.1 EthD domain-containing protein [Novosphingobium sp.]MBK9009597.1 EthD domain-containing protein [Novosphingobium sp.]
MEKLICLIWRDPAEERAAFNARLLANLPPALAAAGASGLRINLEDAIAARGAHLRQSRGEVQHDAVVQFWLPSANALFRAEVDAALAAQGPRWCGWVVAESTIIANTAHPPVPGERTAGWAQLAFLVRPERLSHQAWLAAWQDRHTLVAIETQANFEYVQNLIVRPIAGDCPPYAAVVEECFPEAALCDPLAFFDAPSDPAKFKVNLDRMMESCDAFIERGTIDVIPAGQYAF